MDGEKTKEEITADEAIARVQDTIRAGLAKRLLDKPPSMRSVMDFINAKIQEVSDKIFSTQKELLTEIGLACLGVGSLNKVYDLLKKTPTTDLDYLFQMAGHGPGNVIYLEWALRHDLIVDWKVVDEKEGKLEFIPKKPMEFIIIDVTISKPFADEQKQDKGAK